MVLQDIQCVFWAPGLRDLSSSDLGTSCESEMEAFDELYTRIASEQNPVSYINTIYDNAEIELEPDTMNRVVVRDYYTIRFVYAGPEAARAELLSALTLYPKDPDLPPVGMLYAAKRSEGPEPHFEAYLADLSKKAR